MRTLLSLLLLGAIAAAQSFDELMPDSTVAYVSIENIARTKERFGKSPLAALWKDEAVQAFAVKPLAKWEEFTKEMSEKGGIAPGDVIDLMAGQVVFGLVRREGATEPQGLILCDIGENGEKVLAVAKKLDEKGAEKGVRRDEEEFRGVKLMSYSEGEQKRGAWCLDGKMFAFGENADVLKDMLARKEHKGEGTLAARALYQRLRGRVGGRASDVLVYVDGPNLFQALADDDLDENEMRILGALGLTSIEGLAAEGSLEPGGIVFKVFLGVKGEKTGLLKILAGKNSALLPPAYTPGDAFSGTAFTLDVPGLWEEARRVADQIEQGTSAVLDGYINAMKQRTGVDIQADFLASLGTELTFFSRPRAKDAAPARGPMAPMLAMLQGRFCVGVQVKDRERLEGALDKLLAMAGPNVATTDYLGVKLRTINTPLGVQPAMAVLPDRFVFAMAVDDLKEVIARYGKETKGYLDREDVAKAIAALPAQRFYVSIEDLPKSISEQAFGLTSAMTMAGSGGMNDVLDMSLFPSAEVLSKYLGLTASCMVNEDDGVSILTVVHLNG